MINEAVLLEANWHNTPFPHTVVDGLWDDDFLRECRAEFPKPQDTRWRMNNDPEEFGKMAAGANAWGFATNRFFNAVRGDAVAAMMEKVTGIDSLTADDIGGGMHMTGPGGRLEMHIDFNVHPTKPLERRLNMLVFLNDDWDCSWGGCLLLGDDKHRVTVVPEFNKTVIFECSDHSYHGHPEVIEGEHWRRSLACYFYAPLREGVLENAHTTVWRPSA